MHIVIIWQRFLPYHVARLNHVKKRLYKIGHHLTAVEVASGDESYGFITATTHGEFDRAFCFPGVCYHELSASAIHQRVLQVLETLEPDIIFAPASPFPEGMASLSYRLKSKATSIIMDDAWEDSDQRSELTRKVKRHVHRNADGAFVPALSHREYYRKLDFPVDRIIFGVDVVDNDYYWVNAEKARHNEMRTRREKNLPKNYFLFVGRFIARKGIETLLEAYKNYRTRIKTDFWDLVLVGEGEYLEKIDVTKSEKKGVHFRPAQFGNDLCDYYGLARALIVPSEIDPWALVVNEGLASGLPVIVSKGCGSAGSLVRESENGWTFKPRNAEELSRLLHRITLLSSRTLSRMSNKSREIISEWSLDRFADGIENAIKIRRRPNASFLDALLIKFWKGKVRIV